MKGLLLKDFYMTVKYCKLTLVVSGLFLVISFFNETSLFFMFYPCMICGLIPSTLLAYDERSRWQQYSMTMPYSKAQIVSSKYLIGLVSQLLMLIVIAVAQAIKMSTGGGFVLGDYLVTLMTVTVLSLFSSSVSLPFMFKLGVEKGRLSYYVMVGVACALSAVATALLNGETPQIVPLGSILPVLCIVAVGVYALSWYLAIVFFKKREL